MGRHLDHLKQTERILLVDDEPMVLDITAMMLQSLGYRVDKEACPKAALDVFCLRSREIDLVITDYNMPRMTGVELAREIFCVRPDVPIILFTGDTSFTQKEAGDLGFRGLALKPLSRQQFGTLIRNALDNDEQIRGESENPRAVHVDPSQPWKYRGNTEDISGRMGDDRYGGRGEHHLTCRAE